MLRRRASRSRQAASPTSVASWPGRSFPAPARAARPGRVLHHLGSGAEPPLHLLGRPGLAAQAAQPLVQGVGRGQQVADVVGGIGDLHLGQRPLAPVGEPLGVPQAHADRLLERPLQRQRPAQAKPAASCRSHTLAGCTPKCSAKPVRSAAGACITLTIDRVGDQRGNRVERRSGHRVDHGEPGRGGNLHEAQAGRIGALPDELRVDGEAPGLPRVADESLQARGVRDLLDLHDRQA